MPNHIVTRADGSLEVVEVGPMGPPGKQGERGVQGIPGSSGTASVTSVDIMVTVPGGFVAGISGSGEWPVPPSATIAFANQESPENDGVYQGGTTDPDFPLPLVRISDLPGHTALITATSLFSSVESLADVSEDDGFSNFGPYIIGWIKLGGASAWGSYSVGLAGLIAVLQDSGFGSVTYRVYYQGTLSEDHTTFNIMGEDITAAGAAALLETVKILNPICTDEDNCSGVWTPNNTGSEEAPVWVWAKADVQPTYGQLVLVDQPAELWDTSQNGETPCWRPIIPFRGALPTDEGLADGNYHLMLAVNSGGTNTYVWDPVIL